jgi:hypothetical protein
MKLDATMSFPEQLTRTCFCDSRPEVGTEVLLTGRLRRCARDLTWPFLWAQLGSNQ